MDVNEEVKLLGGGGAQERCERNIEELKFL